MSIQSFVAGDLSAASPPGATRPYQGTLQAATRIGGDTRASTIFGREQPITWHYGLFPHTDQSHLQLREGDLLMVVRGNVNTARNSQINTMTVGHYNCVAEQMMRHFDERFATSPTTVMTNQSNMPFSRTSQNAVRAIDSIPPSPEVDGVRSNGHQDNVAPNDIAAWRKIVFDHSDHRMLEKEANGGYFLPSPKALYRMKQSGVPVVSDPMNGKRESVVLEQELKELIANYRDGTNLSLNAQAFIAETTDRIRSLQLLEDAKSNLYRAFLKHMRLDGRMASKYETRRQWNFLGVVNNTSYSQDGANFDPKGHQSNPRVNVVMERHARTQNIWADSLSTGQSLWIINKRERRTDGTWGAIKRHPWHGLPGAKPAILDCQYVNVAGEPEMGDTEFVGTVFNDTTTVSPLSARNAALCLGVSVTWTEARIAAARLGTVIVLVRR